MTNSPRVLVPSSGWPGFSDAAALTEVLWEGCRGWSYMNPTSGTSIWEDSGTGDCIFVAYEGDAIVELVIDCRPGSRTAAIAAELERRFDLHPLADATVGG